MDPRRRSTSRASLRSEPPLRVPAASPSVRAMEVRLSHVSLSVELAVSPRMRSNAPALPTITHEIASAVRGLGAGRAATQRKPILRDVSGVLAPGSLTLVLGQPGSGKSSLLKLLSGRLATSTAVTVDGDVAVNGVPIAQFGGRVPQLVSYVPQRDRHFPTLRVHETVAFAHACGRARRLHHSTTAATSNDGKNDHGGDALAASSTDAILQRLGLSHCQDTVVGDELLRGVSGGERKRVTLGEMDVGGRLVSCHDEISTGLDSAATFDIVQQYRAAARAQHKTVVMALLQPAPEVFEMFDDVILLNDGYVLYHGPRGRALEHFRALGLACPPQRDAADFLMDVGTSQQRQYESDATKPLPREPSELADAFQRSEIYHELMERVHAPVDDGLRETAGELLAVPEFYSPFWESVARLVRRDLLVIVRNRAVLQTRLLTLVVSSLLHATLFFQLDTTNVQLVMGILFATVLFLALEQSSQIPAFQAARAIFYKQRAANLFRTSAYVVATSVSQMPMAILQVVVFGSVVYWICGFAARAREFLVFELLLLLTNLAFNAWFFFIAVATPNLHVAEPLNLLSLLVFILFAGFMIARNLIPDYLIWAYWVNPISWCLRSLVINQYGASEFNACLYRGVDYCATYDKASMGEYALSLFHVQSGRAWLWGGVAFMVATYVVFMAISAYILEHVRFDESWDRAPTPAAMAAAESTTDELTDEEGNYELVKSPHATAAAVVMTIHEPPAQRPRDQHFVPVTLAFQDLWYSVPNPADAETELTLLKGISGLAEPGTVTALMGSSGAGKTTLMDVIAGRKTGGKITGQIYLNGHAATDMAIRRCAGYCEQMDVHAEAATVREALTFSAFLRQSSAVPARHKFESVDECLDLLDLRPIADCLVRGSTVEQMKRLTIGVELAAQPSVLFLDEPTSGLDARAAKMIMDGVRKVAASGRTIVCTIHQPSFEVFQVFDRLLLLKRGGETVYFGDLGHRGRSIVEYFEAFDGVAPIPSGDYNPATWMLEVIGAGVGASTEASGDVGDEKEQVAIPVDFVASFKASERKAWMDVELDRDGITRPAASVDALAFGTKRAAGNALQAQMLIQRFFRTYWRTPDYMLTRAVVYVLLGVIFGISFFDRKCDTYQGANAGISLVYATTVFIGVVAFEAALPMASELRASFYRERASQTYNALWYFVGSSLVEIPYVLVVCLLFCGVFFPLAGFTGAFRFLLYWIHMSMHVLLQTYIGEFLAIALPDLGSAMSVGVIVSTVFFNAMGFNPPASALPAGYKWLYHVVPTKFSFSIMGAILFGECEHASDLGCEKLRGELPPAFAPGTTLQQYVARVFLIESDGVGRNFWLVVAYIVVFRVLTLLALRFINHQRK